MEQVPKIFEEECWIIGGGYSLIKQFGLPPNSCPKSKEEFLNFGKKLEFLHDKNVIGVNNAFMLGDWVNVAFWGDKAQYRRYMEQYDAFGGLKCTSHRKYSDNKIKSIQYIPLNARKMFGLTKKNPFLSWNKNSGSAAINLAMHLGAKKIILLGFDMVNDPKTNRSHWHAGYPNPLNTPTIRDRKRGKKETKRVPNKEKKPPYERHLKGFKAMSSDANKYGIEIINMNPNSAIEAFPKMSLEGYFKELVPDAEDIRINDYSYQ